MAGQRLQLKLRQQQALAPQLQQAIKLLQMNRIELTEHIQDILDSNPLLEQQDPADEDNDSAAESESELAEVESQPAEEYNEEDSYRDDVLEEQWDMGSAFESGSSAQGDSSYALEQLGSREEDTLQDHLLWQVNLTQLSDTDNAIAKAIVYALDEHGYLPDTIDDIRASLAPDYLVETDEVLAVLHRVQRMEPVGAATRTAQECILVQLDAAPQDLPGKEVARLIVRNYLDQLVAGKVDSLRRTLAVGEDVLDQAIDLIQSLEPRPGARFDNRRNEYITPDVYIRNHEGKWHITLSPDNEPKIRLNQFYIGLMKTTRGDDARYLKGRLQEARWLLSSLELRKRTLLAVSSSIVERQEAFFEHGEKYMQPLILKEIASDTGLHESTISRATTRKYALTPRGLRELKFFFSSHVRTLDGRAISAVAVKAHLQELIDAENHSKPLSDQALTELLAGRSIQIARRTVAKYRESMGIPSSTDKLG
jgi:RNA polymerase sigma-54 factor